MTNNLINYNYNFAGGLPPLKKVNYAKGYVRVPGSTTSLLYTCPANTKAALINLSGQGSIGNALTININISSTNYRIAFFNASSPQIFPLYINAGQSFYLTNNSGSTLNVYANILEFSDTNPISINYTTSFINGNNTLYTCPANKIALPVTFNTLNSSTGDTIGLNYITPTCGLWNGDANPSTIQWFVVPNGGSPGSTNAYTAASTSTAGTGTPPYGNNGNVNPNSVRACCPIMTAGESIVVSSSIASTSILGFVYTYEVPV